VISQTVARTRDNLALGLVPRETAIGGRRAGCVPVRSGFIVGFDLEVIVAARLRMRSVRLDCKGRRIYDEQLPKRFDCFGIDGEQAGQHCSLSSFPDLNMSVHKNWNSSQNFRLAAKEGSL
jgi:hypothetical protein